MKLRDALTHARVSRGLTTRQLAARSGVTGSLVSQIETGRVSSPRFHTVVALARALKISLNRLAETDPS